MVGFTSQGSCKLFFAKINTFYQECCLCICVRQFESSFVLQALFISICFVSEAPHVILYISPEFGSWCSIMSNTSKQKTMTFWTVWVCHSRSFKIILFHMTVILWWCFDFFFLFCLTDTIFVNENQLLMSSGNLYLVIKYLQ